MSTQAHQKNKGRYVGFAMQNIQKSQKFPKKGQIFKKSQNVKK